MKAASCSRQFSRRHQYQRVFHVSRLQLPRFQFFNQLMRMNDGESIFTERFNRSIVAVVTQYHAFFQRQQVAGIGPLFSCIKRKFVVAGIDKRCFFGALQIIFADVGQQVFQVVEISGVATSLFGGTARWLIFHLSFLLPAPVVWDLRLPFSLIFWKSSPALPIHFFFTCVKMVSMCM